MSNPQKNEDIEVVCRMLGDILWTCWREDYRWDQVADAMTVGKTSTDAFALGKAIVNEYLTTGGRIGQALINLRSKCRLVKRSEMSNLEEL